MTVTEKITEKKERIQKIRERILKDEGTIKTLQKEIETLEHLEIKGMLKELDMPIEDIKELLKNIKTTPKEQ